MKSIVIKCGGSVMNELSPSFFESMKNLEEAGYRLIFVHGGGPDINKMLEIHQVKSEFVNGLRKTTAEVMEIVEMVLSGQANRKLTTMLHLNGFKAVGINGSDYGFLQADYMNEQELGFVGEINQVKTEFLDIILNHHYLPVITPIAMTENGVKLNVNADFAAASVAKAIDAESCIFVTDVEGVLIDGVLALELDTAGVNEHIKSGQISGGMIPKVSSAVSALEHGLQSVMIVSGKNEFFDGTMWNGTKITKKSGVLQ
ncbi:acetylglutamate kinase [Cytobacillus purgationiresistens]|uniref:Acetylglutamate kinase n=1 Tax=Cytobacillus purgationiresistens TaxID=863449 RepID=A0ABU0ABY5_9BACI|nr:acetylglutamate kinase [Cytobacillus purgationiresistens]MDQ0268763.1 acetylglutamate kinase [Cytobacillus purgationiresistens]